jgi:hypothetical protein
VGPADDCILFPSNGIPGIPPESDTYLDKLLAEDSEGELVGVIGIFNLAKHMRKNNASTRKWGRHAISDEPCAS